MSGTNSARMREWLTPQWWAGFVVVPAVLGVTAASLVRTGIEATLQKDVERVVLAQSSESKVLVDGRDVTVTLPQTAPGGEVTSEKTRALVRDAVGRVDGVRSVSVR